MPEERLGLLDLRPSALVFESDPLWLEPSLARFEPDPSLLGLQSDLS